MIKLIKADLYKSFHRMYLYVFMGVLAGLAVLYNAVLASADATLEGCYQSVLGLLTVPLFLVVSLVDIVTAEENKEHTLKNSISFGISRYKWYIAKNISAIIIATVVAIVTLTAFFLSGYLLMQPGKEFTSAVLTDVMNRIGIAFLLYIAAIAMATLLATVIKRSGLFTFAYFSFLLAPLLIFKLLSLVSSVFSRAENAMLMMQAQSLGQLPQAELMTTVWIALAHIAVFEIAGLILFKRQEINS